MIYKLGDACGQNVLQHEAWPANRPIRRRQPQLLTAQAAADPLQHFLARSRNEYRPATDPVDLRDSTHSFDDAKHMGAPGWIARQSEKAHYRCPRLVALIPEQDRPSASSVGVQLLRDGEQMTDRVLAIGQSQRALVARRMFAERHILDCAVGKCQTEGRLLMYCRRDCADVGVIAEDAKKMRLPVLAHIAVDPHANPGRRLFRHALILKQP